MLSLLAYTTYTTPQNTEISKSMLGWIVAAFGIFIFIMVAIGAAFLVLWIMMLISAIKLSEETFKKIGSGEKTLWLVLLIVSFVLGFYWVTSVIYYFVVYRKAKELEKPQKEKK